MPEPDEPTVDELPEIGRRLCGLIGAKPSEPVSAADLREIANERSGSLSHEKWPVILAIRICADALAVHELPSEIRELRETLEAYAQSLLQAQGLRQRLTVAIQKAMPSIDGEATRRSQTRPPGSGEEPRQERSVWPSPEVLIDVPRRLLDLLAQEVSVVGQLRRVLHELPRVDADPRVFPRFAPTNIRMAKALSLAGYTAAEIATVLKPFAKDGPARKQARNTVLRYLQSKSEDALLAQSVPTDAPDRAQRLKEIEEAAHRVMGFAGAEVRPIVQSAPGSAPGSEDDDDVSR